jgi:PGAP1-like protein
MSQRTSEPGVLDALSLLSEVADELVLRSVRDTHDAWADRFGGYPGRAITSAVYAGVGMGLRATSAGLGRAGAAGLGPRLDAGRRGRLVRSAVNGLIGDSLAVERPRLAITMAVRAGGHDVALTPEGVAAAFPTATGRVVVLQHGLCESESFWELGRERTGTTYAETLVALGWTPVLLRANTGLTLRENGVALTSLLDRLVGAWPVPVTQVALVGHSMGGLIIRAAGAVASDRPAPWTELVSDVITLGTPHLGAPIARGIGHGARGLARLPETAAFGRILDRRSVGVTDLVEGLAEEVPPLPHARYRLVAATLTAQERHPVGHLLGDLLVRPPSAYGRDRAGRELFPGADVLHLGRTDHFGLLNHPDVHRALREWLPEA